MKHLRRIFESNEDKIKDISKVVYEYLKNFETDNLWYNVDEMIRNSMDHEDGYDEETDDYIEELTMDHITSAITNIVNGYNTDKRRYESFFDLYNEVQYESQHNHDTEIIDDLFLNSGYKYAIKKLMKDDIPLFQITIEDIKRKDIFRVTTHIWTVVTKRLPGDLFISGFEFNRKTKDSESYIKLTISDDSFKLVDEDDELN